MAETRKHQTAATDPLAQAVRAAIGDDVQPHQSGASPAPAPPDEPLTSRSTRKSAALRTFTFAPAPRLAHVVTPDDDDDRR